MDRQDRDSILAKLTEEEVTIKGLRPVVPILFLELKVISVSDVVIEKISSTSGLAKLIRVLHEVGAPKQLSQPASAESGENLARFLRSSGLMTEYSMVAGAMFPRLNTAARILAISSIDCIRVASIGAMAISFTS